jgi:hypothetical protein
VCATDIFELNQKHYLIVVDYYSKYFEVAPLIDLTSRTVIQNMKNIFSRHGIPKKLISDNATQYSSAEFQEFAKYWEFIHTTSSPLYPKSNGLAERFVQTIKKLLIKARENNTDWQLALLNFRNTPVTGEEYSPAQLLMGRKLNTRLPVSEEELKPTLIDNNKLIKMREKRTHYNKQYYDHGTKPLSPLQPGENVRMRDKGIWIKAKVIGLARGNRSYWVQTENSRRYRRNRSHILKQNNDVDSQPNDYSYLDEPVDEPAPPPRAAPAAAQPADAPATHQHTYITKSGRISKPPKRFEIVN